MTEFPFAELQRFACGALFWSCDEFWNSTLIELLRARDGFILAHVGGEEAKKIRFESFREELEEAGIS